LDPKKWADFPTLGRPLNPHTRSLNFYPTALFRQSRLGYPTLQHICKPAQATARPKACKRAAISHPQITFLLRNSSKFSNLTPPFKE